MKQQLHPLARSFGATSSHDLTRICLERIERGDPELNAFTAISPTALADASESDARLATGSARSALEGIPVAIKDNLLVAGLPATWGSRVFAHFVPSEDELPVARLRQAGAVIIGKTNTPEFSARGYTGNALFGITRNPSNTALTPGGSSGGSAAAVAAGMVPLALGTDGGGSTRRPAAHTGIVGLKPSIGRIARGGGFLPINLDFETVGLLGRTVDDVAALAKVMVGESRSDPRSRLQPPLTTELPGRPLRLAYVEQIGGRPVDPAIRASVASAASRLQQLGHEVVPMSFPFDIERLSSVWGTVLNSGLATLARQHADRFGQAQPAFIAQVESGAALSAMDLFAALSEVAELRAGIGRWFESFDVMLTPTTAAQPWPAEHEYPAEIDGVRAGPRDHAIFTGWVNVSGHPAISVPIQPDPHGLPIGLQLVGDLGADGLLLTLARAISNAA